MKNKKGHDNLEATKQLFSSVRDQITSAINEKPIHDEREQKINLHLLNNAADEVNKVEEVNAADEVNKVEEVNAADEVNEDSIKNELFYNVQRIEQTNISFKTTSSDKNKFNRLRKQRNMTQLEFFNNLLLVYERSLKTHKDNR